MGGLLSDDWAAVESVPTGDLAHGSRASIDVLRVSRDLPKQSNVGAMFIERRFDGSLNRVIDLDAVWRLGNTWALTLLGASSWTMTADGRSKSGSDVEARLNRQGRVRAA